MDNEKLFNILEKLLDECEYFCKQNPTKYNHELEKYCGDIRNLVFDEKSNLTFSVVVNPTAETFKTKNEVAYKLKHLLKKIK
jgi:hypothetical protein